MDQQSIFTIIYRTPKYQQASLFLVDGSCFLVCPQPEPVSFEHDLESLPLEPGDIGAAIELHLKEPNTWPLLAPF